MRKILLILLLSSNAFGAWDKGFNFRTTSGFVTDGANETYVLEGDAYPTVRNGVTFGWNTATCITDTGGGGRDRDAGIDRRIAGMNFVGNQLNQCTFQVDLPAAGTYLISLGMGDAGGNAKSNYVVVKDNTTALITFAPLATLSTPTFGDAAGNTYTAANWTTSQTSVSKTFATTTFNLVLGSGLTPDGTDSSIDHIFISQVASTPFVGLSVTPGSNSIRTTAGTNSLRTTP